MQLNANLTIDDENLSTELSSLHLAGVTVTERLTAAVQWDSVVQMVVVFASYKAISLFADWLKNKIIKNDSCKITINGLNISADTAVIERAIERGEGVVDHTENSPNA